MTDFELMGYGFYPNDEEIITYYLERKMAGLGFPYNQVNDVDICNFEPWELPELSALSGDEQWCFFSTPSPYANGKGTKRTTKAGYWKVTRQDVPISNKRGDEIIGKQKTLVFYKGRGANGKKTNWVIHEYHSNNASSYQKAFVFCRLKGQLDDKPNTGGEASCSLSYDS